MQPAFNIDFFLGMGEVLVVVSGFKSVNLKLDLATSIRLSIFAQDCSSPHKFNALQSLSLDLPFVIYDNLPSKLYHLAGQAAFVCLRYIGQENINGTLPGGTLVLASRLHIDFLKTFSSLFNLHRSAFYSEVLFCKFLVACISSFPSFL